LPLFLNGLLLTVVPSAPVLKGMVVVPDGAPWVWFGVTVLLVAGATLLALLAVRGKPERVKHMAALPAAFLLTFLLLMMWGVSTDVVTPETEAQSVVIAGKVAAGQAVSDHEIRLLKSVRQARIFYEMAAFDVQGSVYTPQDVLWDSDGYPATNEWCR
jgi:hypothetical protein